MNREALAGKKASRDDRVVFTEDEVKFVTRSRLARVATVSRKGQPHVVPVAYEFDGTAFYFSGWNLKKSLKFRNLTENEKVALVIDDLLTADPWKPRGLEVRGTAELCEEDGRAYVKITPLLKRSWGFR